MTCLTIFTKERPVYKCWRSPYIANHIDVPEQRDVGHGKGKLLRALKPDIPATPAGDSGLVPDVPIDVDPDGME